MSSKPQKLRGRFTGQLDEAASAYIASIGFDRRLYRHDITGSIAHARMLGKTGIIKKAEADRIITGLEAVLKDIESGKAKLTGDLEDIHMNVEALLAARIGEVAGKLHTARSRNDQIALDMRLYIKDAIDETVGALSTIQAALIRLAEANKTVVMPGYTHLQRAQPVLFAHYLLAYFEMFQRDVERLEDCLKRVDVMPLGSGALAGVAYPVDRDVVAKELGFGGVSRNSLDAVSDRDFVVEYEAAAALIMVHLSRLAEEIILWSSTEFDFIEVDDAYATGSSIMPQKKNADTAELARGKAGRVFGHLAAMLTTLKGLSLAYNRDMQEDKEGLFDTVDAVVASLSVMAGLVATLKVKSHRMRAAAVGGYTLATDIADYLVKKGLPFRKAHSVIGGLVKYAAGKGKGLSELTLKEYRSFSPRFGKDVLDITLESSVASRSVPGGTSPEQVNKALAQAKRLLRGQNGR
ncbi:MAG: argininosuccinate lyase [Chloroflexota bacterium]